MKKYFLLIFLSFSLMNAENQSAPESSETDKKQESMEQIAEKKVENPFEKLPEGSFVKEECMKNGSQYHCQNLKNFFYCAQNWNEDLQAVDNKTLAEEATCAYCSHYNWQKIIGDSNYWKIAHHVINLGTDLKKSPQEIVNELELIINHCEQLNEPVRKCVQEWQEKKARQKLDRFISKLFRR